ncbi:hypothetical protein D770_08510 [Flammeovirgaceae bacterium 311]|nr:hypothetical protein D770_08510 [Flammeovirgaceae bacterium 311]
MKPANFLKGAGVFLMLILGACTSAPVEVVSALQQPGVDYTAYKTFNFLDVTLKNETMADANSQEIGLLKNAIAREMEALGYNMAPDPDLWVNIGIVVEQKVQTRQTDIREAPIYIGQRRYRWEAEERVVRRYEQGTVSIDIIDAERRERIWEGVATGIITDNQRRLEKRINEAMEQLFDRYPGNTPD